MFFFDTTLRDGEQTPGVSFHLKEKVKIARALDALGVDIIEAGFAGASKGDFAAIEAVSLEMENAVVCSLARCVERDIIAARDALAGAKKPRIHLFIATSPIHMEHKLHMTPDEVLKKTRECVAMAKGFCEDIEFSCEDATRSDWHFLCDVVQAAIEAGATTVNIPDTVGYAAVSEYGKLITAVRENVPNIHKAIISVHCHDDLGLGVATTLEGLRCGARQAECTLNGLGERAGNAALEEIVMGLHTRQDYYGLTTGIKTQQLYKASKLVAGLAGIDIAPNKAVLGANAFLHQSGIHQHGVLNNRATYEVMRPEDLGIPQNTMVLGKLSGRHALMDRASQLGYNLTENDLTQAFDRFKDLADRKKEITDKDIMALLREQLLVTEGSYQLTAFQVFSGNQMTATATVTLKKEGDVKTRAACGDGPVEACFQAVDIITGVPCSLESYNIKAVTEGQDALGEVTVRAKCGEITMLGKGVSTDILEASCLAYLNAVNRIIAQIAMAETEALEKGEDGINQ